MARENLSQNPYEFGVGGLQWAIKKAFDYESGIKFLSGKTSKVTELWRSFNRVKPALLAENINATGEIPPKRHVPPRAWPPD